MKNVLKKKRKYGSVFYIFRYKDPKLEEKKERLDKWNEKYTKEETERELVLQNHTRENGMVITINLIFRRKTLIVITRKFEKIKSLHTIIQGSFRKIWLIS